MADAGEAMSRRIGEVVASSSASFTAQCYQLYAAPPLGSFVRTDSSSVVGVVSEVATEPLDSTRPVLARGESAATEDEVFQNNPQISRLLVTRFDAIIIGHQSDGAWRRFLPPTATRSPFLRLRVLPGGSRPVRRRPGTSSP